MATHGKCNCHTFCKNLYVCFLQFLEFIVHLDVRSGVCTPDLGLIHDNARVQHILKLIINRLCLHMMGAINYGQSGEILGNH